MRDERLRKVTVEYIRKLQALDPLPLPSDFYEEMIELMALAETWMRSEGVSEKALTDFRSAIHTKNRADMRDDLFRWKRDHDDRQT